MLITLSFLSTIGNIVIFLLVLSLVICIHELGHLIFAKRAGILCHEYSFGMGPRVWSTKKGETRYSIRAIPFGGFVSMAGEEMEADILKVDQKIRLGFNQANEVNRIIIKSTDPNYSDYLEVKVEDYDLSSIEGTRLYINEYTVNRKAMYVMDKNHIQIAPKDRSFVYKTKWERFLTTFAGPFMNFILAFAVFFIVSLSIGVADGKSTVVSEVSEGMPAYGIMLPEDEIISINGVAINSWTGDTNSVVSELAGVTDSYQIVVNRNGTPTTLDPISPQLIFYGLGFTSAINSDELIIGSPLYVSTELEAGDKIISIDGVAMTTWADVIAFAKDYTAGSTEEAPTQIIVERDGVELIFNYVAYGTDVLDALGYEPFFTRVGIAGSTKFSFFGSFGGAWQSTKSAGLSIFKTLGLLFSSKQVGVSDLSGFVGIFSMTSQAAAGGIITLLSWVGLLSVNLGIINLLPIPALDGGRIVFIAYEAVSGRKPNQKVENLLHTVMFFLLMGLLIFITYNDILRLFK